MPGDVAVPDGGSEEGHHGAEDEAVLSRACEASDDAGAPTGMAVDPDLRWSPYQRIGRVALGGLPQGEPTAVHASTHRHTPYRPDSVLDAWSAGGLVVRAASVRGDAHRARGVPRQDDLALSWVDAEGELLVAVADGVSASPLSHLGATTACRYAIEHLAANPGTGRDSSWRPLFEGCAWSVVEAAQRLLAAPVPDAGEAERICATTLCVAVLAVEDDGVVARAATVGDTGVALLVDDVLTPVLGRRAGEDGVVDLAVTPLPRLPGSVASGEWAIPAGGAVLIGTDGIWDPVGDGLGVVGEALRGALSGDPPDGGDYLRLVDLSRITHDDDRTLVTVMARPDW